MQHREPARFYGEEGKRGGYECVCKGCGRTFMALTPLGCYCIGCRKPIIDALQLRTMDLQPVRLDCSKGCGRWVDHAFSRYEAIEFRGKKETILVYYACRKCGAERLYGYQDPMMTRM